MADEGHERSDIDVRHVLLAGAGILGAIVVAVVVAWGIIDLSGGTHESAHAPPRSLQPQLEPHPMEDIAAYRAQEQKKLSGYGWVDRGAGIVRIPVERAMDILAARAEPAPAASSQPKLAPSSQPKSGAPSEAAPAAPSAAKPTPRDVRQRVGLDPHLGARIPLGATLRDEHGKSVRLGEFFGRKPAILALVYYHCPNLCNLTLNSLVASLRPLDLRAGRDFDVIAVSIDPRERATQAVAKRNELIARYAPTRDASCAGCDPGWHLLTGDAPQIAAIAQAVGFRYFWDATQEQFAHPAGITIITPQGRIARYFGGLEFPRPELRWALLQARQQQIVSTAHRLWLLCYHYEALIGKYSSLILSSLRFVGIAVVLALAALILGLARSRP